MDNLGLLNNIFSSDNEKLQKIRLDLMKGVPIWLKKAIEVYAYPLVQDHKVHLIVPKSNLAFDQFKLVLDQIEKRLNGTAIIVADNINPKYRSLMVRGNIPFIYKDKSIFVPNLGIKLIGIPSIKRVKTRVVSNEINPFELKLISGYLTGFIVCEGFNLNQLGFILLENGYKCSKSKLSRAINSLANQGFLTVQGRGPNRIVIFNDRQDVWEQLNETKLKDYSKTVEGYFYVDENLIKSGETALASYSDLSLPEQKHFAVTRDQLAEIEKIGKPLGDFGRPLFIYDVLREPAELFSINGETLNPVELFFLMKRSFDERIQIALDEMLAKYSLKRIIK